MQGHKRKLKPFWKDTIAVLITLGVYAFIYFYAPFQIAVISGSSMEPTLHDRNVLLFFKTSKIEDNQVVIFKSPKSWNLNGRQLIKRVVAKPGDKLSITEHSIYVNNQLAGTFSDTNTHPVFIEKLDGYFVRGDNVNNSYDSLARVINGETDYLIHDIKYSKTIKKKQ